mmetsp:Transcript_11320/g.23983  ORF Transcript_11320/g.23983 Transcript_11320/m.23983 type:complete len:119 (+) Transcript_11320:556-912(+)
MSKPASMPGNDSRTFRTSEKAAIPKKNPERIETTERNGWGRHPSGHGVLRLISNRNHNHRDHNHNAGHAECKPRREKQSNAMQCNASLQRNPAERNQWFEIFDSFFGFETTTPNKVYT